MKRLCLLLCFLTSAAQAGEPACSFADDHPLTLAPRWYGLYYQETKIGHATTATEWSGSGDDRVAVQRFDMTFKLEQTEESIAQVRQFEATPPHRLIAGSFRSADRFITYEQIDGELHLLEGGVERVWPAFSRSLCDEEDIALYRFLESNPEIGSEVTTTDFDVEHLSMMEATHRVDEVGTRRILGADHVFHTILSASDSEVFSYKATAHYRNGEGINFFLGPIELRMETEAIAQQPNTGIDLFAEFEKSLNQPLRDPEAIDTLTLKVAIDDPAVTIDEVVGNAFLQRVEYLDPQTAIVSLADYDTPRSNDDLERYRRPTSSHPSDHPRLRSIIAGIMEELPDGSGDLAVAEAILRFVADYIDNVPESPYAYHTSSVFDILDNRTGDCTEHSQLFVTLARAAGLPAREATGFVYTGDDAAPSLGGHAWAEVHVDGRWIGLDPTWEEMALNKSHVQTRNDFVPSLTFEVLDVTYR